jgi:hypothetical protein
MGLFQWISALVPALAHGQGQMLAFVLSARVN